MTKKSKSKLKSKLKPKPKLKSLSISDRLAIRQALAGIDLILAGAVQRLETNYGPNDLLDRTVAVDALLLHARESVGCQCTAHEMGEREVELTDEQTSLRD